MATEIVRYVGINDSLENIYEEKYKILLKDRKIDLNKIINMSVLPQIILKIQCF